MTTPSVLITGASSGIGEAAARAFLEAGWNVAAGMRRPAASPLPADVPQLAAVALDVTDGASIRGAVEATLHHFGRIDAVVNNAGYALMGPVEALSPEELRRQFDTNLFGLAAVTCAVLPQMRRQGGGAVVNVSSIGGRMAFPFAAAYHASKFAVEGLSEAMRFELQPHGIRVKLVEPGGIRTNFIARGTEWASHPAYEPQLGAFRDMTRGLNASLPGPEKVAAAIVRAAADRSGRLRYPVSTGPYPLLNRALPDTIWRRLVGMALSRQAGTGTARGAQEASRP